MRVPKLIGVNNQKHTIEMEYLDGLKLKDYLNQPELSEEQLNITL